MKVRLKHEDGSPVFSTLEMFQFHEGPIKTNLARIEAGRYSGFNSMKVRLKPPPQGAEQGEKEFQFHEGPIKTGPNLKNGRKPIEFQFHEGPIKTCSRRSATA